jgi:hypothetical protein
MKQKRVDRKTPVTKIRQRRVCLRGFPGNPNFLENVATAK